MLQNFLVWIIGPDLYLPFFGISYLTIILTAVVLFGAWASGKEEKEEEEEETKKA